MANTRKLTSFKATPKMNSDDPLVAAKAYVEAGLKLVVLHGVYESGTCTCGNKKCDNVGKHPDTRFFPHGSKDATDNMYIIEKAFKANPDANLGATLKNLTIVDEDGPEGKDRMMRLELERTVRVKTKRGVHSWYLGSLTGGTFKAPQIDILTGAGTYIVVPPSVHESGHQYKWLNALCDTAAPVPKALLSLKNKTHKSTKKKSSRKIPEGERNNKLFHTSRILRTQIHDEELLYEMLAVLNEEGFDEPLSDAEFERTIASSERYLETVDSLFGRPKVTDPKKPSWLWFPYLPNRGVTILAGDPGKGKSLLLALKIAIVTSGFTWPLLKEKPEGRKVLLLSAEDDWETITLNRLIKMGATIDNIRVMHKFNALTPERLELLNQYMMEERPDLVVVDMIANYLGGNRQMNQQNEMAEFLGILTEIAKETDSSILATAHLNKQTNEHPLNRIVGSIGFVGSVRSVMFLGNDPDDSSRLALAHGKYNNSEPGRTIIFEKEGGGRHDFPILKPVGYSDASPAEVCKVDKNAVGRPQNESEKARDFILGNLTKDPVTWIGLETAATGRSIASEGTLKAVRAELAKEGLIEQVGRGKKAMWRLKS